MAAYSSSPREHFVSNLSAEGLSIPLQTQWVLRITPQSDLFLFFDEIRKYVSVDHSQLREATSYSHFRKFLGERANSKKDGLGLYFAQSVDMPGDSLDLTNGSIDGDNVFLQGNLINSRQSANKRDLNTSLLETDADILDGLIRPWIIACGYRGNCEIPTKTSLKADIEVVQYSKGMHKKFRKIHHFIGCTPHTCDGSGLVYNKDNIVAKKVSWIYNYYHYQLY